MKILLLGDTHGDRGFTLSAIRWAAENEIDRIVQLGDFGYWPRVNNGQTFIKDVAKEAVKLHVPLYWIDGNHEDHDFLDALPLQEDGTKLISSKYGQHPITYLPRGHRWEWGGVWFGAFGGAISIDRAHRTKFSYAYGWFPQEGPDEDKIPDLGHVDVLLTHDAPVVPPDFYGRGFKADEDSMRSQRSVYRAMVASGAKVLVHGHWHHRYVHGVHGCHVVGLGMNQQSLYEAGIVYDTDDRRLHSLRQVEYRDP